MRSIRSLSRRAIVLALAMAISGSMFASSAIAEDVSQNGDVQLNGVTNVCYNATTFTFSTLTLDWDGTNLTWPTTGAGTIDSAHDRVIGGLVYRMRASGDPGNRFCYLSSNNTDFTNGTNTLLPKTALQVNGTADAWIGSTIMFTAAQEVPLGAPGAGLSDPLNTKSGSYTIVVDLEHIDTDAPAGLYTSNVTVTVSSSHP